MLFCFFTYITLFPFYLNNFIYSGSFQWIVRSRPCKSLQGSKNCLRSNNSTQVFPHLATFAGNDAIMHSGGLIATDFAGDNFDLGWRSTEENKHVTTQVTLRDFSLTKRRVSHSQRWTTTIARGIRTCVVDRNHKITFLFRIFESIIKLLIYS